MMHRRDFVRTTAATALASRFPWLRADATLKSKAAAKGILYGSAGPITLLGEVVGGLRIVQRSLLQHDLGVQRFSEAELVGGFAHCLQY